MLNPNPNKKKSKNKNKKIIAKAVHHAINITSMEAELFAIRCGINHAIHLQDVTCIIVITNAIQAVK